MSNKLIEKRNNSDGWKLFLVLLEKAQKSGLEQEFFDFFLTSKEISYLSKRCLMMKTLLTTKKTQREISGEFQIGIGKVTRGSNGFKNSPDNLKSFLVKNIGKS